MGKVYITDYIKNPSIEQRILGNQLTAEMDNEVEVVLVWHAKINNEFIDRYPNLKGVVRYGVGFDNVDVAYANSKGITVSNTPDYGTDEVSDTTIAMIMDLVRKTSYYHAHSRTFQTSWQENIHKRIKRNSDTKVGIVGAGRIGGSVILKCNALKFQTLFFDPYKPSGHEKMLNAKRNETLDELLAEADIISVHVPLNEETRNMINPDFIAQMKTGSILINTARGKILSELDILYKPLKEKHLEAVGLDVLPEEPPKDGLLISAWKNHEKWLWGRLIINPHTAYYSRQAYREMRLKAALNAKRIIEGKPPLNIIR